MAYSESPLKGLLIVHPNPSLTGGELQLAAMSGAKQALYAAQRQERSKQWFEAHDKHGMPTEEFDYAVVWHRYLNEPQPI